MSRGRWIFDRATQALIPAGEFYARKHADDAVSHLPAPMLLKDIEPYRSTITGEQIGGRRQHRDHLKAHGCIELGNEMPKPRAPVAPTKAEMVEDIKRAMEDPNLQAEARVASKRAQEALPA